MEPEEAALLRLDEGAKEAADHDKARHARYAAEDEATAALRARDEALAKQGADDRARERERLEAALAERTNTPLKQAQERVAALEARVTELEAAKEHDHQAEQVH